MSCRGRSARNTSEGRTDIGELGCDHGERLRVRGGARSDHDVDGRQLWQQLHSHDLAETPLQLVTIHGRMAVAWHDHSDSWTPERGSEMTDVEVPTPYSLPLSNDGFQFAFARQPKLPRKTSTISPA